MEIEKKKAEWIWLSRSLLETYSVSGFISATRYLEEEKIEDNSFLFRFLFPNCSGCLDDFFIFSGTIFRMHAIIELNKIINNDCHCQSITLFSFVRNYYGKNSEQFKKLSEWKKKFEKIRVKIEKARNEILAHLDSESIHGEVNFELYAEDVDSFIKEIFILFDYLYYNDMDLKNSFDTEIDPGLNRIPSEVGESHKEIQFERVNHLKTCCSKCVTKG